MARILLTDDESHVRHVMKFKLERAGHEVLTAADGHEGLQATLEAQPDVVVSDQQMPRMSGLELCRRLFADPATAQIPVILVTSREFEIAADQTRDTNVRHIMSKPFSPRALVAAIEAVLAAAPRG